MTRQERFVRRNAQVRKLFYAIKDKNPKWRVDAVIEETAQRVFLASRTVEAIISYEGIYAEKAPKSESDSNQPRLF